MLQFAVYTTIHPGNRPFLKGWYTSVQAQSDQNFELWIGIDDVSIGEACDLTGMAEDDAHWVPADEGDTPSEVRERAWRAMLPRTDAVVMTDGDDVLHVDRIKQSREGIANADIAGCALELIDEEGKTLNTSMPPESCDTENVLPYRNVFGLSNTAYRSSVLDTCLPLPQDTVLADWYLATQAWLRGHKLYFNAAVGMFYRQHSDSTLAILPPFTVQDIRRATEIVQRHFALVVNNMPLNAIERRRHRVKEARKRVDTFAEKIVEDEIRLAKYAEQLNEEPALPLWWACVDHPNIESL